MADVLGESCSSVPNPSSERHIGPLHYVASGMTTHGDVTPFQYRQDDKDKVGVRFRMATADIRQLEGRFASMSITSDPKWTLNMSRVSKFVSIR